MRVLLITLMSVGLLSACERPPMESKQLGYRGTGMQQVDNPRLLAAAKAALPAVPVLPTSAPTEGPKAKDVYQNVKVLGDLSVADFTRHMLALTQWVSPTEGCTYCHVPENLADDSKYTKVVARRMIEMTQHLNADWKAHVANTGVTCYTCHRGKPVPENVWFTAPMAKNNRVGPGLGDDAGQNKAEGSIALASLPYDPFSSMLSGGAEGSDQIRVQGIEALPQRNHRTSTKQAEFTYSLMNHFSKSLGVNCTFCHNTQSFQSWEGPPQRATAWHGIRMARDLNSAYLTPLTSVFPAGRLGPTGDVAKVSCATCHQGVNKPLGGLAMAKDFGGLLSAAPVMAMPAATAVPTEAAPAGTVVPVAMAEPLRSVIYFPVGSPAVDSEQAKSLDALIKVLNERQQMTATVSGFHSASGTLAQNQELAKRRAFSVRDALMAAGVAEDRIKLQKPVKAEANAAGEDAQARRVEVVVQ